MVEYNFKFDIGDKVSWRGGEGVVFGLTVSTRGNKKYHIAKSYTSIKDELINKTLVKTEDALEGVEV